MEREHVEVKLSGNHKKGGGGGGQGKGERGWGKRWGQNGAFPEGDGKIPTVSFSFSRNIFRLTVEPHFTNTLQGKKIF